MRWAAVDTPIGELGVAVDDTGVCAVSFGGPKGFVAGEPTGPLATAGLLATAVDELRAYFAGTRTAFTVPLSVRGGTAFERAVWSTMNTVPYGEMITYGEIAALVGDKDAARAVGVACNRNPIPVIQPCHRVVGADGKLVGFGGGLPRKRHLLELEARVRMERDWATR